jgi:site-specific DNA-methyltransferase (adenine-specific)
MLSSTRKETAMEGIFNQDCLQGMAELADDSIDLIVTDPPYEILDMESYFNQFVRILKPRGSLYVFGNKNVIAEYWFSQMSIPQKELLVWSYKNSPKPKGRWRMSMQAIIYGYFNEDAVWNEDEARIEYQPATKKLHGRIRPSSGRYDSKKPYDTSKGALPRDVIEHPALLGHLSRERVGHPDQKPLTLIEKLIKVSSNENDLVLDAFAGSGTTIMACINTNRRYLGFEKNNIWFENIQKEIMDS